MAKELMEIGGFITSGAEIVNHDNTLSGNGTVDSPLGLNNETVLFENAAGTSANITLSEPLSGFNTCKIFAFPNEMTVTASFVEEWPADTSCFGMSHWVYLGGIANFPYVLYCTRYDVNGNTFTFNKANHTWFDTNFTKAGAGSTSPLMITKIVGINRKA